MINGCDEGRTKVLLLTVGLTVGGTEGQLLELASRLDSRRFGVLVCSLKGEGPLVGDMQARGVRVVTLNGRGPWDVRVPFRLAGLLRRERPDILHAFLGWANLAASVVGRPLGVPVIIWSYRDLEVWKTGVHWLVDRLAARWADAITCCSEAVRQFVLAHLPGQERKCVTVHNGVDLGSFRAPRAVRRSELGLRDGVAVIGTVARLDEPKKGLAVLLHSLARLAGEGGSPPWQLLLVGDGPARDGLDDLAVRLRLSDRVVFAGQRRDVASLLPLMDLFVCPSLYEGFGIAVVEAMASGRPVVASATGGITEIVVPGETGLLVPPGDVAALAGAIGRLLSHPDQAKAMGKNGRQRVHERFSIEAAVQRHQQLYESLRERGVAAVPVKSGLEVRS